MSAYPPPPRRADGTVPPTAPDESPLEAEATLYAASPHHAADELLRRRRERKAQYGRSHAVLVGPSHRINPTYLMLAVLVLGFSYLVWRAALPARGGRGTLRATPPWTTTPTVTCTVPDKTMVSQKTFTLSSRSKGCHLVQAEVEHELRDMLKGVQAGVLTLFLQHTSAALSLNENYDKDVRTDMDMALDTIVPESLPWRHTDEGPDDSASHTKASLIGPSVTVPVTNGRMNLGTWQGIVRASTDAVPVRVPPPEARPPHRGHLAAVEAVRRARRAGRAHVPR